MDGINEAVVKQLKEQKGGEDVLPLWKKLWKAYQQDGSRGVDDVLGQLLHSSDEKER